MSGWRGVFIPGDIAGIHFRGLFNYWRHQRVHAIILFRVK